MRKRSGVLFVVMILCISVYAVSAEEIIISQKYVTPEDIYLYGDGQFPDKTTVTLEINGYGGRGSSDTLAVVFAIDSSGSMRWTDPSNLRLAAAGTFVDKMLTTPENDRGGVVSWDNSIDFTYGLVAEDEDNFDTLKKNIHSVNSVGDTNLNTGLNAAIGMLNAEGSAANKVIILVTDGGGVYTPSGKYGSPADDAAKKGIVIYPIGLAVSPGSYAESSLMEIAEVTGGLYFPSPSASNLDAIFASVYAGVTNTVPYTIDLMEVTESYIVAEDDFSIIPDSVTENDDGTTTMFWTNVGRYVGNKNDILDASETFVVTFTAGSDKLGILLPVSNLTSAKIRYNVQNAGERTAEVGQAYINVTQGGNSEPTKTLIEISPEEPTETENPIPAPVPEFPIMLFPLSMIVSIFAVVFILRR
ncbi:MAG: vWA domain-containing protein [Methanogenium sp.]|jgi:Ca-activated chloride channel family protein